MSYGLGGGLNSGSHSIHIKCLLLQRTAVGQDFEEMGCMESSVCLVKKKHPFLYKIIY
jgi:hypothetical protein